MLLVWLPGSWTQTLRLCLLDQWYRIRASGARVVSAGSLNFSEPASPLSSAISISRRLRNFAFHLARIRAALRYLVGKEFERSVVGGLDRPRPVMHAIPGAGLRATNGRRYTTGPSPLRAK